MHPVALRAPSTYAEFEIWAFHSGVPLRHLLILGSALALVSSAQAADLITTPDVIVDPIVADWSGFYAGFYAGYGAGDNDWTNSSGVPQTGTVDISGAFGGVYAGYNWQVDQFVFGLEGSAAFANLTSSWANMGVNEATLDLNALASARARVGVAFDPVLLYLTGGLAAAQYNGTIDPPGFEEDGWVLGYTVGAGAELKLDDAWSVRAEYTYSDFEAIEPMFTPTTGQDVQAVHAVQVGIAYHF